VVGRLKAQPEAEVSGRNGLERLYGVLTPEERLAAVLRADARGGAAECERLVAAAPRQTFSVPDCHGLQEGLSLLALRHLAELASLAACYWRAAWERDREGETKAARALARRVARAVAHNFRLAEEGWALFMAGLGADDPEAPLRRQVGWPWLQSLTEEVRRAAPGPEEVAACFGLDEGEAERGKTAEDVAAFLRAVLAHLRGLWS
jgi:hypothetical protein